MRIQLENLLWQVVKSFEKNLHILISTQLSTYRINTDIHYYYFMVKMTAKRNWKLGMKKQMDIEKQSILSFFVLLKNVNIILVVQGVGKYMYVIFDKKLIQFHNVLTIYRSISTMPHEDVVISFSTKLIIRQVCIDTYTYRQVYEYHHVSRTTITILLLFYYQL